MKDVSIIGVDLARKPRMAVRGWVGDRRTWWTAAGGFSRSVGATSPSGRDCSADGSLTPPLPVEANPQSRQLSYSYPVNNIIWYF